MPSLKPAQLAFFSYAHEDAEFAQRLAKDLRAGGAAVWIDRLDIKPGQRWDRAIEDALAKCPQLLVILSPDATESTNVMDEVSLALEEGKTVLPVVHRQCKIPFRLRRLQYVDLTLNYNEGLGRLLETLGFAVPSSKVPEDAIDEELTRPSTHDGGAEEGKFPSHAAPGEREPTERVPKKRARSVMVVVGMAAVLIALAFLAVVVNVIKQQKKRPSEQTAQGPSPQAIQLTASGQRTPEPSVSVAETPVIIDAAAQYELAQKYEKGMGLLKNPAKALQLYEESAASGYAPAQFTLGVSYELGNGMSKDLGKAVALYQQAADQGYSDAICKLGILSEYGIGMPKNADKAIALYQKAAAQGNAYGQMMLGHIYEYGDGVPRDIDRAIEAYTKAADMGNSEAKRNVARLTASTATTTTAERRSAPREDSKAQPALPNFAGTWEMISWVENDKAKPLPVNGKPLVITQNESTVRIGNRDVQISNAGTVGYQDYYANDANENGRGHKVPSAAQADLIDTLKWRIEGLILVFETTFEYKHTYGNHAPGTISRVMKYRRIGN